MVVIARPESAGSIILRRLYDQQEKHARQVARRTTRYDLWSSWSDEVGHEFENHGSECCPEYAYPDGQLFDMSDFAE